jgi:hypothetical protein
MRLSRPRMFLFLNGMIAAFLLLYFSAWMIAPTTRAFIYDPYQGSSIGVRYKVEGKSYTTSFLRSDIPLAADYVRIRYLKMIPSISKVDSFLGIFAEPLGWWLIFFIASAFLLLPDNVVFRKGTVFMIRRSFPYIWMEEYYPAAPLYEEQPSPSQPRARVSPKNLLDDGNQ